MCYNVFAFSVRSVSGPLGTTIEWVHRRGVAVSGFLDKEENHGHEG
jgi:hypothetical protein